MESENRFCPFKYQIEAEYKNGKKKVQEKYIKCCGNKCMAYDKGFCLRLGNTERKLR